MTEIAQAFGMVPIERLRIGANVRAALGDVAELAESIRRFGMLEPIVGCPAEDGMIDVLMGQRRLAAAAAAGLATVPTLLRPKPGERDRLLMQLAENLERADMTPIEEAHAFAALVADGLTQIDVARAVNRSQHHVSTRLQLLDMPGVLQDAIHVRAVSPAVALSLPRGLFAEPDAVERLARAVRGGDSDVRSWAYAEVKRLQSNGHTVKVSYQLNRPVSVPIEHLELAQAAAGQIGKPTREWIRDAIETAAAGQGLTLPEHVTGVARTARPSRSTI